MSALPSSHLKERTRYAVGFAFSIPGDEVVLIRKLRPAWQEGLLNGVGGHVEDGERPVDAMRREFKEEAGVWIHDWTHFATMYCDDPSTGLEPGHPDAKLAFVQFFSACMDTSGVCSCTDEVVGLYNPWKLPEDVISELYWLIPMALHIGGDSAEWIQLHKMYEKELVLEVHDSRRRRRPK